ncbi:MAG: hypothetical protein ACP5UF_06100 [Hydrogenobaculum sp.]
MVRQEIETVRQELKGEINAFREEVRGEIKIMKMWIIFLGILIVLLNQSSLALIGKIIVSIFK